jgi:enoyl-CoA hydratase/carnithine racemase
MIVDQGVARITVGTGARQNALDGDAWHTIGKLVASIDPETTTSAVIAGMGDTFCAGSDMTEWVDAPDDAVEESFARMEAAFVAVETCPVPVIASVAGTAAGAGCQLALSCDLRVFGESTRIGMPIARLGILPSAAFASRIMTLAGPSMTRRLLYTGKLLTANEALAAGLADDVVPDADIERTVDDLCARIGAQPPVAIRAAKSAVSAALRPIREASQGPHERAVSGADFRRGIQRFLSHGES